MDLNNEKNYKIIEFNCSEGKKGNYFKNDYILKNYNLEKKYLISKKDYENGIKYIKGEADWFNPEEIFYYYKYEIFNENKYNNEFVLVNKEFLESLDVKEKILNKNYVCYFKSGIKQFIYFEDDVIILEITKNKEVDQNIKFNNKDEFDAQEEKDEIKEQQNILKILLLLYAYEKHLQKLLNSPIEDEYDFQECYLIDRNFIEKFKKDNEYENLIEFCNIFNYSYKGFCINLKQIINSGMVAKHKVNPNNYDVKDLYPKKTEKIKSIINLECLDKFILVPKNLFDLLYNNADKSEKYSI